VHVEGRPLTRGWDAAASGQKRYRTEVVAERMVLLDSRGDRAGASADDQAAGDSADVPEGEAVAAPF
jgi:single-stranded DNA-binding protein